MPDTIDFLTVEDHKEEVENEKNDTSEESENDNGDVDVDKLVRENLPEHVNEVELGAQKGKSPCFWSLPHVSFSFGFYFIQRYLLLLFLLLWCSILILLTGLLSPIGDPLGRVLYTILSPLGNQIGNAGDRMSGNKDDEEEKKDEPYQKFGGKEQNGQNPLGL